MNDQRRLIEHGRAVLDISLAVRNASSAHIADQIRVLLDTAVWKEYQLPTGETFVWRDSEFDLFLAAVDFDPRMIEHAARATGDRALLLRLAEASDRTDTNRRSISEITSRHPHLAGRLEGHLLGGRALHRIIARPAAREAYLAGRGAERARRARHTWRVEWPGPDHDIEALAQAIAQRLTGTDLGRRVAELLTPPTGGTT